ncbi:SpoIID/LytB domain-containing protein [Bacillota bacterium LX-D]|nr:SpoIID/LytB domain-containing protein [Bacillota bacterium LX-D]
MKRISLLVSFSFLFVFLLINCAFAEEGTKIKVGLASSLNQAEFKVVEGNYQLIDVATGLVIARPNAGEKWVVSKEGLGLKVLKDNVAFEMPYQGPLLLNPENTKQKNVFLFKKVQYSDQLFLQSEDKGILAVNILDIEKYLYGVVGMEIGNSAPLEALKAQAVVSRTYALAQKGKSTRYDVGIDTATQVYGGYSAQSGSGWSRVKEAVDDTKGLVIYYNSSIIKAFFHANSGGYTENCENVFVENLPYLKGVPAPEDEYALSYAHQSNGWPASTYKWEKTISRTDLKKQVDAWNNKSSNKINVGEIIDFTLSRTQQNSTAKTVSNRVTQFDFVGTNGTKSFYKDSIRSVLGLKSTLFDLQLDSTITVLDGNGKKKTYNYANNLQTVSANGTTAFINEAENYYWVQGSQAQKNIPKVFQTVVINGKGYGHGLGMSQWGAWGLASQGYNYISIIKHYYNQDKNDGHLTIAQYR